MDLSQFQIMFDIFGVPTYIFDENELLSLPEGDKYCFPQKADVNLKKEIKNNISQNKKPFLFMENDIVYYGLFGYEGKYYCLGPVGRSTVKKPELIEYKKQHNLKEQIPISRFGMGEMTKILALLYQCVSGQTVSYDDIHIISKDMNAKEEKWKSDESYEMFQISQSEYGRQHGGGIEFENQVMGYVRNGDINAMKTAISGHMPDISDFSEVATNNAKQMEYMLITILTLITRAAVEGGMNSEEAYVLGDIYMRRIEACHNDIVALTRLGLSAQIEFTEKVYNAKKHRSENLYIEKCKDYVVKNLRKNIKVGDIAPELGISRTYLTHKFSEIEGMTIQQYIVKERCEHAANLLKFSDYPISVIAEYFCFSSQSHFGACFKKQFGMTPKEYRSINTR